MDKINFIFLRSIVGDNKDFKDAERDKFLAKLNNKNDFVFDKKGQDIFFIETGGTEEQFKKIYLSYKEPYILLATNANNSLPASLEIATFLRKNNKEFYLIHGTPGQVKKQLKTTKFSKKHENLIGFSENHTIKNMRFGVIGKPSDWLIASEVDYKLANEKLGVSLIDISSEEFLNIFNAKIEEKITTDFDKFATKKVSKKSIHDAIKIYDSIKDIISKYNLDGITIRCFDLLGSVSNTSCLALALLNSEGIIATCEGDIPTMLTMAMVRKLFGESSFQVNPSYINLKDRFAYFAHCTLPFDMCESFKLDTHFESGIGVGIKGKLKEDDVTIFRLNSNLHDYEIFEGKIEKNLNRQNLCRTQIKVTFKEDISPMFTSPNGNHLVVFYGKRKKELVKILSN